MGELNGVLCIGDLHLASRVPGFRKDDYSEAILEKLQWSLAYAAEQKLLPILLGDIFHWPKHNANWLISRLLDIFEKPVWAVAGNHDCGPNGLTDDDSLSILIKAGKIKLLDQQGPFYGKIGSKSICVGGSSWGTPLPKQGDSEVFTIWITHHDIGFKDGLTDTRLKPKEIPGIDIVVNGHLHRRLKEEKCGQTLWMNPGSLARVSRGDASRSHTPMALKIDLDSHDWIAIPHKPFDEVFHPVAELGEDFNASPFITALAELQARRTSEGAGLQEFLDECLQEVPQDVADEVRALAQEVIQDA